MTSKVLIIINGILAAIAVLSFAIFYIPKLTVVMEAVSLVPMINFVATLLIGFTVLIFIGIVFASIHRYLKNKQEC